MKLPKAPRLGLRAAFSAPRSDFAMAVRWLFGG